MIIVRRGYGAHAHEYYQSDFNIRKLPILMVFLFTGGVFTNLLLSEQFVTEICLGGMVILDFKSETAKSFAKCVSQVLILL